MAREFNAAAREFNAARKRGRFARQGKMLMEDLMRINAIVITLAACICGVSVQLSPAATWEQEVLQRNSDLSAAARQKPRRHKVVPAIPSHRYRGFADPSFGPDGRPYQVPEYLRGQCYFDDGYGRFVPCSNRS